MSVEVDRDTPEQEEAPNNEVMLKPERNWDEDTFVVSYLFFPPTCSAKW